MNYITLFQQQRIRLFQQGGELGTEAAADVSSTTTNGTQESTGPLPKHGEFRTNKKTRAREIFDAKANTWINVMDPDGQKNKRATEIMAELDAQEKQESEQARALSNYQSAINSGVNSSYIGNQPGQISAGGAAAIGGMATVGVQAMNAVDQLAMGDKNFGSQSKAIDDAVHGVSGALIKSGNPYAMAAGAGLEAANFLTKATGQNTQGYDVNMASSGYGTLGHKDSSASRDFLGAIGLGGLDGGMMDRKLAARNEQAQMALKAANVSDTIKFQQEARMNSVDDALRQNQIALAGGLDTNAIAN